VIKDNTNKSGGKRSKIWQQKLVFNCHPFESVTIVSLQFVHQKSNDNVSEIIKIIIKQNRQISNTLHLQQ